MIDPLLQIRQNLHTIRECYGVARIGIFGSVARGEATRASDIDILVEFREGEEIYDHFMDLTFYLEDIRDAEIAALERRREKAEQIEQRMMRQFLNGCIRLAEQPKAAA
jgi:predicted nucleotidyltransferase